MQSKLKKKEKSIEKNIMDMENLTLKNDQKLTIKPIRFRKILVTLNADNTNCYIQIYQPYT